MAVWNFAALLGDAFFFSLEDLWFQVPSILLYMTWNPGAYISCFAFL